MSLGNCNICGRGAGVVYPLLPGSPKFCSEHHTPQHAGPFGADFTPSDAEMDALFDEFVRDTELVFKPPYNPQINTWKEKSGRMLKLTSLDDSHLFNIRRWIVSRAADPRFDRVEGVPEALAAIDKEIRRRAGVEP